MKRLTILVFIILYALRSSAYTAPTDSTHQQSPSYLDTLQQQLTLTTNDSLKSGIYIQLAAQYLKYDGITDKKEKQGYQAQVLNYTYLALHIYSRYNDTTGMVTCFNNLATVYRSQKKYPQAKWFILQSNSLSRAKNDVPNIMASLIILANIKMEIKDYALAMSDLNEALKLSTTNHYPKVESRVQESYALLYSHLKDYTKEAIAEKRHNFIEDSISKGDEASLIAKIKSTDSLQNKKKVFTTTGRRIYKTNSSVKIASL